MGSCSSTRSSRWTIGDFRGRDDKCAPFSGISHLRSLNKWELRSLQKLQTPGSGGLLPYSYRLSSHLASFILSYLLPYLQSSPASSQLNNYVVISHGPYLQSHPTPEVASSSRAGPARKGTGEALFYRAELQQKGTRKNQDVLAYLNNRQYNSPQGCGSPHPKANRQIPTTLSGGFMGPLHKVIMWDTSLQVWTLTPFFPETLH